LKSYAVLFLFSFLIWGCSSSEKKTTENQTQQTTDPVVEQTSPVQDSVLTTRLLSAEADTAGLTAFSGQLNYTGNEPFTSPALFITGGVATYKLSGDETFMEETFDDLSGKSVTIYGKIIESDNSTLLEVHYYELRDN
jgi:hypothetical protein